MLRRRQHALRVIELPLIRRVLPRAAQVHADRTSATGLELSKREALESWVILLVVEVERVEHHHVSTEGKQKLGVGHAAHQALAGEKQVLAHDHAPLAHADRLLQRHGIPAFKV